MFQLRVGGRASGSLSERPGVGAAGKVSGRAGGRGADTSYRPHVCAMATKPVMYLCFCHSFLPTSSCGKKRGGGGGCGLRPPLVCGWMWGGPGRPTGRPPQLYINYCLAGQGGGVNNRRR